ncbi:hypothetical protein FDY98_24155 (plasmid) [Halomonas sp. PA16-9]|nr:hypothetical protein FDY98_24155 [Halomonas sp. PA16-9]
MSTMRLSSLEIPPNRPSPSPSSPSPSPSPSPEPSPTLPKSKPLRASVKVLPSASRELVIVPV